MKNVDHKNIFHFPFYGFWDYFSRCALSKARHQIAIGDLFFVVLPFLGFAPTKTRQRCTNLPIRSAISITPWPRSYFFLSWFILIIISGIT